MNDTILLFTGIGVFGLMLIAVILTVVEFAQMDERHKRVDSEASAAPASAEPKRVEDRD
jgi:hypothetical protein